MEPECRRKYAFNTHNKEQVLRLRAFLHGECGDCLTHARGG
jgi:hypothetical protein